MMKRPTSRKSGTPGFDAHRKIHTDMVRYVGEISAQYEQSPAKEQLMQQFCGQAFSLAHQPCDGGRPEDRRLRQEKEGRYNDESGIRALLQRRTRNLQTDAGCERRDRVPHRPGGVSSSGDKINIMVGFTGDYSGETYYIFPRNTALEIVKSMSGMEIDEIDEFVTSALSEISNIISGNAMTGLSELAIACDIQPPQLVESGGPVEDGGERVIRTDITHAARRHRSGGEAARFMRKYTLNK